MLTLLDPFRFVLTAFAGWMNHRQRQVIEYLRKENRVFANSWANAVCVSAMTSGVDWPPKPKDWDGSFCGT